MTRYFKYIDDDGICQGRYTGSTPKQAVMKVFTKNFKNEIESKIIKLKESTKGSNGQMYSFICSKQELNPPLEIKVGDKIITYKYKNIVKRIESVEAVEIIDDSSKTKLNIDIRWENLIKNDYEKLIDNNPKPLNIITFLDKHNTFKMINKFFNNDYIVEINNEIKDKFEIIDIFNANSFKLIYVKYEKNMLIALINNENNEYLIFIINEKINLVSNTFHLEVIDEVKLNCKNEPEDILLFVSAYTRYIFDKY